jgi:hypothetical protein
VFVLVPGMGAYMPSTAPHLVENGDGPSVTVSFTYYTDATRRDSRLHAMHQRLRGWGMQPAAVGTRPVMDGLLDAAFGSARLAGRAVDALRGRATLSDRVPYAHAAVI